MAVVRARQTYPVTVHQAQTAWCDVSRWPDWVDGLARVVSVDPGWPEVGSAVVWRSGPAGRGQVTERVEAYEALAGITVGVQDDTMLGTQRVGFEPVPEGVRVEVALEYRIRRRNPVTWLVEWLFVRRPMITSLTRSLERFGAVLG